MNINFNQIRKNLMLEYNLLTRRLNNSICKDTDMARVIVPVRELEKHMNNLQSIIGLIACTFDKGNPEFEDVLGDNKIFQFNPENEF